MDFLILILTLWLCWGLYQVLVYVASRSRNLPPGPRPLPVIGNLLELGSHPHISLAKLARVHGPIMSLKLGCMTTIVVSSAPIAREILQTHDSVLSNRTIPDSLSTCCFDELGITFMPISPLWRNYRRISNLHLFSRKALDFSQHLRNCKIQELLVLVGKYCNTRTAMDIGEAVFTTAVNPLGNMIFSMDLGGATSESTKDLKELVWNIEVEVGKTNLADYFPVLRWADPQGAKSRMEAYFKRMFDLFDRIISKRLETRTVPSSDRKNDLLDALLDLAKDKEEDMNMPAMKNINLNLFVAGTDTTSITLEWAMAELLRNPDKLVKVQAELGQVIGRGKAIEDSDIARLPYLQATLKEVLRMHPAAPLLVPRRAGANVQVSGYTIPEGAQIFVNVWAIGRDPTTWENPEEFIPERFLGSDIDVSGQNFELLPFGGGRRICLGRPLATIMLHLMLGSLINCFDWKLEDGVSPADVHLGELSGLTVKMAKPIMAVPVVPKNNL